MQDTSKPGRVISIIGLVFAFVGLAVAGLVLSIIGLVRSKRAGKADVIAILGVVFNVIAIVVGGIVVLLVVVAYGNVQARARDTTRMADVQYILGSIDSFTANGANGYPSSEPDQFRGDMSSAGLDETDKGVFDKVVADEPSASRPDGYRLVQCGGDEVTGMEVHYYSELNKKVEAVATGSGCAAPIVGSEADPTNLPQSDL